MRVEKFDPYHLRAITVQPAQAIWLSEMAKPEYAAGLIASGPAFSALDGTTVIACAGIINQWAGRAIAWAVLADSAKKNLRFLTREIDSFLSSCAVRRVETTVVCDFKQAVRWAEMLGFDCEGKMRAYTPEGADHYLYARVR